VRVAVLVIELGRGGGPHLTVAYARALAARPGVDVDIVTTAPDPQLLIDAGGLPVRALEDVGDVDYDVAIGTWWTTAAALFELHADRRLAFLQNLDTRFYRADEFYERFGAAGLWTAPVEFIVSGGWMAQMLAELRPDARVRLVRNGYDKRVWAPRPRVPRDGPLRILVEGVSGLWYKGATEALEATTLMREPRHVMAASLDGSPPQLGEHEALGRLEPEQMADVLSRTDVLLKLARFEGSPLTPVEAFHQGVPCVITPFSGWEDFARPGENCLLVGFDEPEKTAAALDSLASDEALLARLSAGAGASAAEWPDLADAGAAFADAVVELADGPRPSVDVALRLAARWERACIEQARVRVGELLWAREELAAERAERLRSVEEARILTGDLADVRSELAAIQSERVYRAALAVRRAVRGA
jgi:glycosyltransferase involved in cell wall biosynthesis